MLKAMRATHPNLQFAHHLPYGAILSEQGVQFVVFSRSAFEIRLLLYRHVDDLEPADVIRFDSDLDRWGDVWSVFVPGIKAGQLYHFQASGPHDPLRGMRFNRDARLVDPYAKALAGKFLRNRNGVTVPPKCVVVNDFFDWEGDRHLRRDLADSVIYELHVRGFTQHASSGVQHPGTYLGVIEKIPYLKSLGVTTVELMPVHEFPKNNFDGSEGGIKNYWGYDPLAFFAPHSGYAFDQTPGAVVHEFKTMVKELHAAGIEVILDVVFNHTCEGNEKGPTLSFKGLENNVYYMLEKDPQYYRNYSGCGNTVNGNHPVIREMIFHCLRRWVHNYHIDGFRFDLASILSRDRNGNLIPNPPIVELIAEDPMLADTKIVAEAWDAAGAYQVGSFGCQRWAEWNGRYRDDVRRFWRGDAGMRGAFATRLAGSADLYQAGGRSPWASINFVTSHDGFTLNDLVSYNKKHNAANGEENRDGENNNHSCNHGHEGPTSDPQTELLRLRQIKNFIATLMISQGVPMLVAGDEIRRTQQGNNNAYCQDNQISWFDWRLVEKHGDLFRFTKALIQFRRNQPTLRRRHFLTGATTNGSIHPDVSWYSHLGTAVNWHTSDFPITCFLTALDEANEDGTRGHDIMAMFNSSSEQVDFMIPMAMKHQTWHLFCDTAAKSPQDVFPDFDGPRLSASGIQQVHRQSLVVFVSRVDESRLA
jgi:isoamylase